MLARLLPGERRAILEFILSKYHGRYRTEILPTIRALPGVRELVARLKQRGAKIAIAAPCRADELDHFRGLIKVDEFVDVVVSADDVRRGRPHSEVVSTALHRLGLSHPSDAIFIGDTPYDAEAAHLARARSIGVLTGHYPRADLLGAGCSMVFLDLKSLNEALSEPAAA
jgi:HAD superfamily hydrolase (TIGR01509 family)